MILAGDFGGTNSRLALLDSEGRIVESETLRSRRYDDLSSLLCDWLGQRQVQVEAAAFGLAGAVVDGVCKTTNQAWVVDSRQVAADTGIPEIALLNDLEANAYGIFALRPDELEVLQTGDPVPRSNRAVIAPGTGLGEAGLIHVDGRDVAVASEGGNCDFGPSSEIEDGLLAHLRREYGTVSYEMVVSGPGLVRTYRYLQTRENARPEPELEERMRQGDPAAVISQAAMEESSELCVQALDLWTAALAAEAGNTALKFMAAAGLYIGGGIAPRILPKLRRPRFMQRFADKYGLEDLLKSIPVSVILNDRTALLGAAHYALTRWRDGVPLVR